MYVYIKTHYIYIYVYTVAIHTTGSSTFCKSIEKARFIR